MSDASPPPQPPAAAGRRGSWNMDQVRVLGSFIFSLLAFFAFFIVVMGAFWLHDTALINQVTIASITAATTALSYWVGSSKGSDKKDDAIIQAQQQQKPPGG